MKPLIHADMQAFPARFSMFYLLRPGIPMADPIGA